MGLFSRNDYYNESTEVLSSIDTPSIFEGAYDCSPSSTYRFIAENDINYNNIMKAVGIEELACFENGRQTFMLETEGKKGFFNAIINFLSNIWEKIKAVFRKFIGFLDKLTKNNKDFITKYKSYLNNSESLKDFKYTGFKFTVTTPPNAVNSYTTDSILNAIGGNVEALTMTNVRDTIKQIKIDPSSVTDKTLEQVKAIKKIVEEDSDDFNSDVRRTVFARFTNKNDAPTNMSADDLSNKLFEAYRNGEKEKKEISGYDINVNDIITNLTNTDSTKETVNKNLTAIKKAFELEIKEYKNIASEASKQVNKNTSEDDAKALEVINQFATLSSKVVTAIKNTFVVCQNAWLKAISDNAKQDKAIALAIINKGSKKSANESYSFTNEGGYLGDVKLI